MGIRQSSSPDSSQLGFDFLNAWLAGVEFEAFGWVDGEHGDAAVIQGEALRGRACRETRQPRPSGWRQRRGGIAADGFDWNLELSWWRAFLGGWT